MRKETWLETVYFSKIRKEYKIAEDHENSLTCGEVPDFWQFWVVNPRACRQCKDWSEQPPEFIGFSQCALEIH